MTEPNDLKGALSDLIALVEKYDPRVGLITDLELTTAYFLRTHGARLKRALEDAERYAWLRSGDNDEPCLRNKGRKICDADSFYLLRNELLDAAIDAARASEQTP